MYGRTFRDCTGVLASIAQLLYIRDILTSLIVLRGSLPLIVFSVRLSYSDAIMSQDPESSLWMRFVIVKACFDAASRLIEVKTNCYLLRPFLDISDTQWSV